MLCPACHNLETKVVDSRELEDGLAIRRRRECEKCTFRFSTVEEIEILNLTVVKHDGREESYNKEKLIAGLQRALQKRPISQEKLKRVVQAIEQDIQLRAKNDHIQTTEIGEIVMKHLKKIDKVAYIRFASVYHEFEDLKTFHEAIDKLIPKHK